MRKQAYNTKAEAKQALAGIRRKGARKGKKPFGLKVYQCPTCGLFHLGHQR